MHSLIYVSDCRAARGLLELGVSDQALEVREAAVLTISHMRGPVRELLETVSRTEPNDRLRGEAEEALKKHVC
jgi:hypothetical protein